MAFCKNCGNQIEDNAATCPNCGASQNTTPQVTDNGGLSLGIVRLLYPDCRSCLIPCVERHQTKDIQGYRYRRIGRCNPDDPVLYTNRSGWCRLCRYGILRLDESLDL